MKKSPSAILQSKHCVEDAPKLSGSEIRKLLPAVRGWAIDGEELCREYKFENYFQTMSFVTAVAMIAQEQNHHPDMKVGYNKLEIRFTTHSAGGLSENDFICASRVNGLMKR